MKIEEEQRYWFEWGYKAARGLTSAKDLSENDALDMVRWFDIYQAFERMRVKHVVKAEQESSGRPS
jgi:hypothetical protein